MRMESFQVSGTHVRKSGKKDRLTIIPSWCGATPLLAFRLRNASIAAVCLPVSPGNGLWAQCSGVLQFPVPQPPLPSGRWHPAMYVLGLQLHQPQAE